ncbi:MAG: hypothetical protein R3E79_47475 [Caldilineaceae bacterium]
MTWPIGAIWRPFDYLNEQIHIALHYLHGEKVIQGFHRLSLFNVTHNFLTWSEREMGGGFVDSYLEPFLARHPEIKYGYLIELNTSPKPNLTRKGQSGHSPPKRRRQKGNCANMRTIRAFNRCGAGNAEEAGAHLQGLGVGLCQGEVA